MNSTVLQGLYITVVGMGLVFVALCIFWVAMVILDRVFRPREGGEAAAPAGVTDERARVAAIAVALVQARATAERGQPRDATLGAALGGETSGWAAAGRARQVGER